MSEDDRWSAPPLQVRDPGMLRAFAHPVRQRILQELSVRNYARAADLAGWLGEPANSLSFHLRTLARAGLIHELPEKARDRRDRVWGLANQGGFEFEDPTGDPATASFIADRIDWLRRLVSREFDNENSVSAVQLAGALLTKAEAKQYIDELAEVFTRWRKYGAEMAEADPDNPDRLYHAAMFAIGPSGPPPGRDAPAPSGPAASADSAG